MRYTVKTVRGMFDRARIAAAVLGIDSTRWTLQEGSKENGVAFRLFDRLPGETGLRDIHGLSNGFLGMTARDATQSLNMLACAWELVAASRDD